MLIVEDWHGTAAQLEYLDDLLEPLVPRIECLSFFVRGIVAMFTNDHDAVDGQLVAAKCERLGNVGKEFEVVTFGAIPSQVAVGKLIDENRGYLDASLLPHAAPSITQGKSIKKVLS